MDRIGLYPLSVVLSYLEETEGVSLLITNKRFSKQFLPLFRLQQQFVDSFDDLLCVDGTCGNRRQKNRHRFIVSPVQDHTVLLERINTRRLRKRRRPVSPTNLDTIELAKYEWEHNQLQYPPELELLRFWGNPSVFTDNEFYNRGPILLVSYPRSGNTLVRTLIEKTTGIVTGSDTRPDRSLSKELAEIHNLAGEGCTKKQLYIKTHWPERTGNRIYTGKRVILLIRNPYDAIDSYWNMNASKSHTKTVTDDVYECYNEKFQGLVQNEIHIWLKFIHYWLSSEECNDIPLLIIRFEDLIQDPTQQLTRIMEFSLGQKHLSEFWIERIKHVTLKTKTEYLGSYRPRIASKGIDSIGKSIKKGHMNDNLIRYIHQVSTEFPINYLERFGYDVYTQNFPNNNFVEQQQQQQLFIQYYEKSGNNNNNNNSNGGGGTKLVRINSGLLIRPLSCEYGRLMQKWRHSITNNDTNPLPTVSYN